MIQEFKLGDRVEVEVDQRLDGKRTGRGEVRLGHVTEIDRDRTAAIFSAEYRVLLDVNTMETEAVWFPERAVHENGWNDKRLRRNAKARARFSLYKSVGLSRTQNGSWE